MLRRQVGDGGDWNFLLQLPAHKVVKCVQEAKRRHYCCCLVVVIIIAISIISTVIILPAKHCSEANWKCGN